MSNQAYKNWTLEEDENDLIWLWLDKADSSVNVLSSEVMGELEEIVAQLEKKPPKGLIIASKKEAGFLAGADISEFTGLTTHEQVMEKLQRGQNLFLRIERLKCTTVAAIHGHCMGGGTELALGCDYRVADEANECKIGLPEVKLGIHPGYGGAVRLPRLIDDFQALMLMVAGRVINGKAAGKLGMVDVATQRRHLYDVARKIASGELKPSRRTTLVSRLLAIKPLRGIAAKIATSQLKKKVNPKHYPAPFQLVQFWRDLPSGDEPAYLAEAESVASLFRDPIGLRATKNLVRVFLLDREIKGRAKQHQFKGKHIHVVGAGVMGGDIAAWCALRGFKASLQDAKAEFIAPAMGRAYSLFKKRLKSEEQIQAAMDRLMPDVKGDAVGSADLVIEAITEKLDAKKSLYATLEPKMKKGALLASNTSSIPLEELSQGLANPDRLVGIHFFNPVAMMQLVEVVRGDNSSDESVGTALAFVNAIGKLPIEVKSAPGFLVNRVLMSYLAESMRLYSEGVSPEVIDREAVRFGMPMGPIELADVVGLDICKAVASELIEAFGGNSDEDEVGKVIDERVDAGKLGKKTGEGFYTWSKGKPKKAPTGNGYVSPEVIDRMVFSMLNESVQCLAEGIVQDAQSLDLGMIFGTGFPPFHGGPMEYIRELDQEACQERLTQLAKSHGKRFTPQPGWKKIQLEAS
jgi:3-hydroxyacyl-CoA dehydrogenase/enoyl-CoA hydratase/3-hydroxybutyryl-CoA epimerase